MPPFKLAGVFLIKFLTRLNCREIFCYLFSISFFFFFCGEIFCCDFHFRLFLFFLGTILFGSELSGVILILLLLYYYYGGRISSTDQTIPFYGSDSSVVFFFHFFNIEILEIFFSSVKLNNFANSIYIYIYTTINSKFNPINVGLL